MNATSNASIAPPPELTIETAQPSASSTADAAPVEIQIEPGPPRTAESVADVVPIPIDESSSRTSRARPPPALTEIGRHVTDNGVYSFQLCRFQGFSTACFRVTTHRTNHRPLDHTYTSVAARALFLSLLDYFDVIGIQPPVPTRP